MYVSRYLAAMYDVLDVTASLKCSMAALVSTSEKSNGARYRIH
jgi:hypothetical protein